jgi:hypothetical protein
MHLRPFTKDDWEGLAGCDSKYPFTCDSVTVPDHDRTWEGILVVDNHIIQFHLYDSNDDELILHCKFDSTEQAITWAMKTEPCTTMSKLMAVGFVAI